MKLYKRKFKESDLLENNAMSAMGTKSVINSFIGLYKAIEDSDVYKKDKMLKRIKSMMGEVLEIDDQLSDELKYNSITRFFRSR